MLTTAGAAAAEPTLPTNLEPIVAKNGKFTISHAGRAARDERTRRPWSGHAETRSGRWFERKFDTTFVNDDSMIRETRGLYVPLSTYETIYGRNSVAYMIVKSAQFERAVEDEDETKSIMTRAHNGIRDTRARTSARKFSRSARRSTSSFATG